jgi:hypothetical protein
MKKIWRLINSLSLLLNPKTWGVFSELAQTTKFDAAVSVSWAQGAEDIALLHVLLKPDGTPGNYLDIGAQSPQSLFCNAPPL